MYNLFQATKIKQQLHRRRIKQQKQQKWLNKYNQQTQPELIQSYNKRINHFVRKIEQKPVIIKQFIQYKPNKIFRSSSITKQRCLGQEYFKFKDKNDWNSIYTQLERTQMERNSKIMEKLFGDSSLAYRSIISQSAYKQQKQQNFRQRIKLKQINPPMKYTFITPQIMIRKYSNKNKQSNNNIKMKTQQSYQKHNTNNNNPSSINRNNSFNLLFDQQNNSSQSFRSIPSLSQSIVTTTNSRIPAHNIKHQNQQQYKKQQKQYISNKLHFKTIRQTFQKTKDKKVKSNIKQLLVKCNIIKSKDKKETNEEESDGLLTMDNTNTEQFRNIQINHSQNSYIHVYNHQNK